MKFKSITALICAGMLTIGAASPLIAQNTVMGADAIAERKSLMKSSGGIMRSAGRASGADAIAVGEKLVSNYQRLQNLWPKDSMTGDTKALPNIWNDNGTVSQGYKTALAGSLAGAQAVLDAANAGDTDAYAAAVKAAGAACGQCHGTYRGR